MKITGSKQRLCCGAWLLATVLLGGLNVFPLMSLEAQPPGGYSRTIRELQTNLQRFDAILHAHAWPGSEGRSLQTNFSPPPAADSNPSVAPAPPPAETRPRSQGGDPPLPVLSGIIRILDSGGSVYFQAVLNGRGYREKDRLDDFTVDQISPAGVILRCAAGTWFIKCPTPYYSSDHGE